MYPGISIRVIHMPVGVDQLRYSVRTQVVESLHNSCFRYRKPRVDKKLAVLAVENRDIASRALQNTDAAKKGVSFALCLRRSIHHRWNNALNLRIFHID